MRIYYLRLTEDSFTEIESGRWVTDVIDLYENDSYTNYSGVQSSYGITGPKRLWVGLNKIVDDEEIPITYADLQAGFVGETFETDIGRVENGRFIDYSGRIDLISFKIDGLDGAKLKVWSSADDNDDYFEDEWLGFGPKLESEPLDIIKSYRFVKLELQTLSLDDLEDVLVRVEVDVPLQAPLYRSTRALLDKYPTWMDAHDVPVEGATPTPTVPTSVLGSFLNAVAGEWIEDLRKELTYREFQHYIDTVDTSQLAWAYVAELPDLFVYSVVGDGNPLIMSSSGEEFRSSSDLDICFINFNEQRIYTRQLYTTLEVNGLALDSEPFHVWNYLDELGLLVDLDRLLLESNLSYQARIRDVYKNVGGVGVDSLKKALRRELDLWRIEGSTPDSDYLGATPEIFEISDIEQDPKYFDPDGMPTLEFVKLVERISREYPTTWGRFVWGRALWDIGGVDNQGFGVIPNRFDATPVDESFYASGVGDGNDLFVFEPDVLTGPRDFTATLKIRGRQRSYRTEYPPVETEVMVVGHQTVEVLENPTKEVWFTVLLTLFDDSVYAHSFRMSARNDSEVETSSSYSYYQLFSELEPYTDPDLIFVDVTTLEPLTEPIALSDIDNITLRQGALNDEGDYESIETTADFEAWLTSDLAQVLEYDDTDPGDFVSLDTPGDITSDELSQTKVVMRSLLFGTPEEEQVDTEPYFFKVAINEGRTTEEASVAISLPSMVWQPGSTDRQIGVYLTTFDPNSVTHPEGEDYDPDNFTAYDNLQYGGFYTEGEDRVFLAAENIAINGSTTWDSDGRQLVDDSVSSLTFSIESPVYDEEASPAVVYPVQAEVWTPFEAVQVSGAEGTIDEDGPWRNGVPSSRKSSSNLFITYEILTRDEFNIPNSDDYVITWIGVESDDSRVIAWLDSNSIIPTDDSTNQNFNYSSTAFEEKYDEETGDYYLETVSIRAKIKPGPDARWSPQIHSGYLYDGSEEMYLYAQPATERITGSSTEIYLEEPPRQGAPVSVWTDEATPRELRQVAFSTDASPVSLTLTNVEVVNGSGIAVLHSSYHDIYDISVTDTVTGESVPLVANNSLTNVVSTTGETDLDRQYEVQYRVRNSFYVDYDAYNSDATPAEYTGKIVFDKSPNDMGVDAYDITYESADVDPATPVGLALNPLYTIQHDGFIYISFDEYEAATPLVRLSPRHLVWDDYDYMMLTIQSLDINGNPKPYQEFELSSNHGYVMSPITTDEDGFAEAMVFRNPLESFDEDNIPESGTILVSGNQDVEVEFRIISARAFTPRLKATTKVDQMIADGLNMNYVYGVLEDAEYEAIEAATVNWTQGRTLYDLFANDGVVEDSGQVVTDSEGHFIVGPFTAATPADAGFWFIAVDATPNDYPVGDVVFWLETPPINPGTENTGSQIVQAATPVSFWPQYSDVYTQRTYYDEQAGDLEPATPNRNWLPPRWFSIPRHMQQLLGANDPRRRERQGF